MLKEFASFHNHSHFSVFDGLSLPEELLKAAKEKGLKSIALTDHGVTHGHADWYLIGKKMGVKAVFGIEAYVIHDLPEWKNLKAKKDADSKKKDHDQFAADGDVVDPKELKRKGHLVLLACNRTGLRNLYQLSFKAHRDGFYGKPRMDKNMLREHAEGLVATTACMGGVISKRLWDLKEATCTWDDVKKEVLEYDAIFGRGRFFLELQFNEMDKEQNYINTSLVKLHQETGVPLTVTTDSHYATAPEWEPRELLHMMGWGKKSIKDLPGERIDSTVKQLYVKSPEEMWLSYQKFAGHCIDEKTAMEAFQGTILIDSLIESFEPDTTQRLRKLPYADPFMEMMQRAVDGLKRLGLAKKDEYKQRLLLELKVIKDKGIANYFLICQQIIGEAKKKMLVGAGRGSAAGSLVCYCLGITDLDPIKHDLLFERFLDVDRAELPDIDTDFEDRDAVIEMLHRLFGDDNVAALSSYGTFQIKGLLKDLGRVYALDHNEVNKVNRAIDKELRVLYKDQDKSTLVIKLEDLERVSPTFNKFVETNPELGGQIKKLYGRIRHVTCHAGGVIIGDDLPAETSIFTTKDDNGNYTVRQASFTEGIVNKNMSAMGFVKMDILGLANLRVIHHAITLITGARKGEPAFEEFYEKLRPHNMNMDDPKILKHVFWKGNFGAIFQFTNPGIRALAKRVKPDSFIDISAIVSLYRPGPLKGGYDKVYVQAKHGEVKSLGHPLLDEILGKTKGCLVFQEQIMEVCRRFGKMTGKEVNRVRKVLLKKDKSKTEEFLKKENDELYASYIKGCQEHGYPEDKALKLWEDIKAFGGYAFNKSHSDAYSVCTMQTAYLATYHPLQFYAAALTKAQANAIQVLMADIKKAGVKVLPINFDTSSRFDLVEGDAIRLSFSHVNGVGPSAIEKILTARAEKPFEGFLDAIERSKIGKGAIEPLILIGAFSHMPGCQNTKRLLWFYEKLAADPKLKQKKNQDKLERLWNAMLNEKTWTEINKETGEPVTEEIPAEDFSIAQIMEAEIQLMEFSLAGSPFELDDRQKKLEMLYGEKLPTLEEVLQQEDEEGNLASEVVLPVTVKGWKEKPQRNGQMFAFIKFATPDGAEFDSPAFGGIWKFISPSSTEIRDQDSPPTCRPGGVYIVTFNRDEEDPENLKVGFAGWRQTKKSVKKAFVDIDNLVV